MSTPSPRMRTARTLAASIAALAIVGVAALITGCSSAEAVEVSTETIILDVRSPSEYAEGHLDGARLVDFNSGEFQAALPNLDPGADYIVYCRSGNRSGQAVRMMEDAGFTNVRDLGPMENASRATGIAITR